MQVYLILYIIIVMLCFFEMNIDSITISNKIKIITKDISFVIIFLFILILGILCNENKGVDTENYRIYYFNPYSTMPFSRIFTYDSDFGFGIVTWIITRFTKDYWVFRAVRFTLAFTSVSLWIRKYSKCVALSYLFYVSMGCMHNDFFILRLSLAISIYIWSYKYLIERKPIAYYTLVLLAATCHKSALFMVVLYPILGDKFKQLKSFVRVSILAVFVFISRYGGIFLVSLYRRNDYSANTGAGQGYGLLLFYCLIFIITLFFCRSSNFSIKNKIKGLMLGVLYPQVLATSVSLIMRVAYYALPYQYIILPDVAKKNSRNTGNIYVFIMVVILSVMFFHIIYPTQYFSHFSGL